MRSSIAAHATTRRRLGDLAAVAIAALPLFVQVPSTAGPSAEAQMLRLVTNVRSSQGVAGLRVDPALARVARARSADMARAGRIWHDHSLPSRFEGWNEFGENVGVGLDAASLHAVLMESPSHRRNILRPGYRRIGIGITEADDGLLYVAQLFADDAVREFRTSRAASTAKPARVDIDLGAIGDIMPWVVVQLARAVRLLFTVG